jgi:hypothetical protein
LWPTDTLLGGFNPDNKGISTNQPISMVQNKENPATTGAILASPGENLNK